MRRVTRLLTLTILATSLLPITTLVAQGAKIGVVDMERAIVQSVEGKKAETRFTAKFEELRKSIETKQKDLETQQTKLRTQERLLSDTVKAELTRDIERKTTDLTRIQEDAQKDLDALRGELMRPIAEVAEVVLSSFAKSEGFTVVIDRSNPQNASVVFVNPNVDITDEVIKRIDAEIAKKAPADPKKP